MNHLGRYLLLIALVFNVQTSVGQTYSSMVSDNEIYNFLNWLTRTEEKYKEEPKHKEKQISCVIVTWDTANFVMRDTSKVLNGKFYASEFDLQYLFKKRKGTDTIFKQADRAFLFQQFISIKDTVWHQNFESSKIVIKKKRKLENVHFYSVPLFSIDRKYVVVYELYYCGSVCAYGGHQVFKKIDETKWILVAYVNGWMS